MSIGTRMSRIVNGAAIPLDAYDDDLSLAMNYVDALADHAETKIEEFAHEMIAQLPRFDELVTYQPGHLSKELEIIYDIHHNSEICFLNVVHNESSEDGFVHRTMRISLRPPMLEEEIYAIDFDAVMLRGDAFTDLRDDLIAEIDEILNQENR